VSTGALRPRLQIPIEGRQSNPSAYKLAQFCIVNISKKTPHQMNVVRVRNSLVEADLGLLRDSPRRVTLAYFRATAMQSILVRVDSVGVPIVA
jgi:hypothetical protein